MTDSSASRNSLGEAVPRHKQLLAVPPQRPLTADELRDGIACRSSAAPWRRQQATRHLPGPHRRR
jgi:hypothetical protein